LVAQLGGFGMRTRIGVVMLTALALVAAACSNSSTSNKPSGGGKTNEQPGVSKNEIRVGGVAAVTNPLNGPYGAAFDGVEAYLAMVNSEGGVFGRKIHLVSKRDDNFAKNQTEVQGLLAQDNVFAALPIATVFFSGAGALAKANIPTFGWNVSAEWSGPKNLFEQEGALCLGCVTYPDLQWLVQKLGKHKLGVLAYGIAASSDCAKGIKAGFDKWPTAEVAHDDRSVAYPAADLSVDVQKMKDKGVDIVTTCMDQNGTLTLAKEMKKQGLNAIQYLPNAYDHDFMNQFGDLFEGSYVRTSFTPFETRPRPTGLVEFDKWMKKLGKKEVEPALVGWIDADMFVTGLRAAGPNFTRQKVIDELNKMTHYTAQGLLSGLDWTIQHEPTSPEHHQPLGCAAITKIENKKFVPVFGDPGKPFICFPYAPPTVPDKPETRA
jgi:branched-chain amino acid transport system substrate-binding protein